MRYFLDTEFNGFGGELISLALVPEDAGDPAFYEVLELPQIVDPWVAEHVIPFLNKEPISRELFQTKLHDYLIDHHRIEVIADWPDDIRYFCESLITAPGCMFGPRQIDTKIHRDLSSSNSELPHNALEDAIGIRQSWIKVAKV